MHANNQKKRKGKSEKKKPVQARYQTLHGEERDIIIDRLQKELVPLLKDSNPEKVFIRKRLRFGINEVTRSIEKGEAALVIWCRDVRPANLLAHLPVLAHVKKVPVCILPNASSKLGLPFGIKRLAAMSFCTFIPEDGKAVVKAAVGKPDIQGCTQTGNKSAADEKSTISTQHVEIAISSAQKDLNSLLAFICERAQFL